MEKTCAILAPKIVKITNELNELIANSIKKLITEENVTRFLFEPKSNFGHICFYVVTKLKKDYPYIQRICYTSKNEFCVLENSNNIKQYYSNSTNNTFSTISYDNEIHYENKYFTDNFSHLERNCKMIDESDICLFYYNENNLNTKFNYYKKIQTKNFSNINLVYSYKYASRNKKTIINLSN